jgi:hypothetical protein
MNVHCRCPFFRASNVARINLVKQHLQNLKPGIIIADGASVRTLELEGILHVTSRQHAPGHAVFLAQLEHTEGTQTPASTAAPTQVLCIDRLHRCAGAGSLGCNRTWNPATPDILQAHTLHPPEEGMPERDAAGTTRTPCTDSRSDVGNPSGPQALDWPPHGPANPILCLVATSGSTGVAKYVRLSYTSWLHRYEWQQRCFALESDSVVLVKSSPGFVDSLWECLMPMMCGVGHLVHRA